MTKRWGNFEHDSSKKQKLNNASDPVWDDLELDENAIEDCFKLATQIYKEDTTCTQLNNVSIMPTYNAFKTTKITSSTLLESQMNLSVIENKPTTSTRPVTSVDLEQKLREVTEKYAEKEGEVTILRSKLKETKDHFLTEQEKKLQEWAKKLNSTQNEVKAVKTQLEFKDLELSHLKQKIHELSKRDSFDFTLNANTTVKNPQPKPASSPKKSITITSNTKEQHLNLIIQPFQISSFPLITITFDNSVTEYYPLSIKSRNHNRNTIPYLQNQISPQEAEVLRNMKEIIINSKRTFPCHELSRLLSSTDEQLNSDERTIDLIKVTCSSLQILYDFQGYLKQALLNSSSQDIQPLDFLYVKTNSFEIGPVQDSNQIGKRAAQCLKVLAELLLYSHFLQQFLLNKSTYLINEEYTEEFPCLKELMNNKESPVSFLGLILGSVNLISQLRKTHRCTAFLNSVTHLLINICKINSFDKVDEDFCKLTASLIFSRPNTEVLKSIFKLFNIATLHRKFVDSLCRKPSDETVKSNLIKGIFYYHDESCPFHVFAMLIDNNLLCDKNNTLSLTAHTTVLFFIKNMLESNAGWIVQHSKQRCCCLEQFYKLGISVIKSTVVEYKNDTSRLKKRSDDYLMFFKQCIKVLNVIVFNSFDFNESSIVISTKYKEILYSVKNILDELNIKDDGWEKLNIDEDLPSIPHTSIPL